MKLNSKCRTQTQYEQEVEETKHTYEAQRVGPLKRQIKQMMLITIGGKQPHGLHKDFENWLNET